MSVNLMPKTGTLTLPEYRAHEAAGEITRPITGGPMRRAKLQVGWAPDTPSRVTDAELRQEAWKALQRRCRALACAGR